MPINLAQALLRPTPFKAGLGLHCCLLFVLFPMVTKNRLFSAIDARIVDALFQTRGEQGATGSVAAEGIVRWLEVSGEGR